MIPPEFFPPRIPNTPSHQESILAMSTDDPDTHGLWFWTQRSWVHRPQINDSFTVQGKDYVYKVFDPKETYTIPPS